MEKTWRWFGKSDTITLPMLRQIGVEGIVTSLYGIPEEQAWSEDAVRDLDAFIRSNGMRWSVVESLPVDEAIKYAGPRRESLVEKYKESLASLGKCGIHTVCYNFMPVLDWIRTDVGYPYSDGSSGLYFDMAEFAWFDICILGRKGAEADYSPAILKKVEEISARADEVFSQRIVDTVIVKTQGFVNENFRNPSADPVGRFKELLSRYDGMTGDDLRENLRSFLTAIMPVCDKYGIDMCIHPDDPPMQVLGLPRIVCDASDIRWILKAVDNPHNGLTFCAGSLSSGAHNDVVAMAREFAPRTRFVHLRSCEVFPDGSFAEAPHTAGRADLVELIRIFEKTDARLPVRVDHGRTILGDASQGYNPGYGFHGRMLALGQVEGMLAAVRDEIKKGLI